MDVGEIRVGLGGSFRFYATEDKHRGDQVKARVHGNVRPDITGAFIHIAQCHSQQEQNREIFVIAGRNHVMHAGKYAGSN